MISPSNFIRASSRATLVRLDTVIKPREEAPAA
jgi:hypothetical protein